jgi:hypothetical protein
MGRTLRKRVLVKITKRQDVRLFDQGVRHAPAEYGTGAIVTSRRVLYVAEFTLGLYNFFLNSFHLVCP